MEIKDNKLIIDIPDGMEVDTENTDETKGVIMLRKKCDVTYENIEDALSSESYACMVINTNNSNQLGALNKLMDIAKYYNKNWKPNWISPKESKYYIYYNLKDGKYKICSTTRVNWGNIYFRFHDTAQLVIDNLNFKSILDAIYKE